MRIYIVEDDLSVINILEDIIETQGLGEICGDCGVRQRADQQGLQRRDRLLYQQADQPDRGPFRIKKCGTADHK